MTELNESIFTLLAELKCHVPPRAWLSTWARHTIGALPTRRIEPSGPAHSHGLPRSRAARGGRRSCWVRPAVGAKPKAVAGVLIPGGVPGTITGWLRTYCSSRLV